ncbi:MAG: hypothetical protein IBX58_04955 [Roseovarius sp.]|nr:hypothetical protein [Roseovarius sp.]
MTYSTHNSPRAPLYTGVGRLALGPLRAIEWFLQSIIDANRMARDIERLLRLSDARLAEMGLKREDVISHAAQASGLRRAV